MINFRSPVILSSKSSFCTLPIIADCCFSLITLLPFTDVQEDIFFKFMDDHPANFPKDKKETFDSKNLTLPSLDYKDLDSDLEKPCILLMRAKADHTISGLCRRMDIVLQNEEIPIALPFDLAGEIIMEKA